MSHLKGEKLITKKCKEKYACSIQQKQNDRAAWYGKQCNPDFWINSHCRCCCDGDLCNDGELPCLSMSNYHVVRYCGYYLTDWLSANWAGSRGLSVFLESN